MFNDSRRAEEMRDWKKKFFSERESGMHRLINTRNVHNPWESVSVFLILGDCERNSRRKKSRLAGPAMYISGNRVLQETAALELVLYAFLLDRWLANVDAIEAGCFVFLFLVLGLVLVLVLFVVVVVWSLGFV
jgi:hypothetical protein